MIARIFAENFQSWSELDFDLAQGVTNVFGYNHDDGTSEGCGKSAIFNALCWGLFGRLPKDTNVDDVIKEGEKSCTVNIILSDGTTIERTRKPNDLAIFYSNSPALRGKDAKETQKMIEDLIGFSYETFLQSAYFAQNSQIKFLTANEENKAKILSDLADLNIFDSARKKAADIVRDLAVKISNHKMKANEIEKSFILLRGQISSMKAVKIRFESEKAENLKSIEKEMVEVSNSIQYLSNGTPELTQEYYMKKGDLRTTLEAYSKKIIELKVALSHIAESAMKKQNLDQEIKKLKKDASQFSLQNADGCCPTCGTEAINIDRDTRMAIYREYEEKIHVKMREYSIISFNPPEKIQQEYEYYVATHSQIEKDLKEVELIESTQKAQKDKIVFLLDQQKKLKDRFDKERFRDFGDLDGRIKIIENAIDDQSDVFIELDREIDDMVRQSEQYSTLKDGFKEVKMYAFQGLLNELNLKANQYLTQLFEQPMSLRFINTDDSGDISKISTILDLNGQERTLGLFSGGQTRRIMLAVDLALSDIAQSRSSKPINLLILDEYFKDLSEESMQKIYRLLESRKGSILLVEHNSTLRGLASKTFEIAYRNGTSNANNS